MTIYVETLVRAALKSAANAALLLVCILATTYAGIGEECQDRKPLKRLKDIKHIIVIYQENWSFDSLYGRFPGADGY
jgi:phospholipase C